MLSKIGQTLRSLVTGDTDQCVRRPSKRSRNSLDDSDDDDIVETPAKRSRFTSQITTKTSTNTTDSWLPFGKVAELFVRGKQTLGENSFVKSIASTASPKRLFRKITSLTSATSQSSDMSKQFDGVEQNFIAPPPYSAAGRGIYGTGAERPAPRVGYVDMPGYFVAPHAPLQQGYDGGFKMPFNKTGMDPRAMQQHPHFSSTPRYNGSHNPRPYRTMYDKTYGMGASGKSAWSVSRSVSTSELSSARSKLAAKESIRLDEKNRYAELLQQFTTTPLSGTAFTGTFARRPKHQHKIDETVLGSRIERSVSHDSSLSRSSRASADSPTMLHVEPNKTHEQPVTTVSASPGLSHRSYVELKTIRQNERSTTKPHTAKDQIRPENGAAGSDRSVRNKYDAFTPHINRQHLHNEQYTTPVQPKFDVDDRESPVEIVKVVEPVRIPVRSPSSEMFAARLKDSPYLGEQWIKDLHSKYSTESRDRKILEQEVAVNHMKEKREDLDEFLQERLKKRLSLHEKSPAVLEEKFEDEEEMEPELVELTEEMEEIIDNALRSHPGGEVLSDGFRLQITRKDMGTLAGLNWLNDEIINFYMELLKERGTLDNYPKVHAFNTFFYPKITSGGHSAVRRWTRKVDVFAVDYILIPVHLGMHWCLAVVDFPKKEIRYYDSMGGRNNQCLQSIKDYLQAESLDKKKQPFDMSDWKFEIAKGIPQQMNGSDCGVFTCKYAEYVSRGAEITFTQENMPYFRRRMVYEILTKKLL